MDVLDFANVAHSAAWRGNALGGVAEYEDRLQDAWVGILQAAETFDAGRGYSFATYATPRARGEVADGYRRLDPLSRRVRDRHTQIIRAFTELERKLARSPTLEEVAELAGIDRAVVVEALRLALEARSLDADLPHPPDHEPATLADLLRDEREQRDASARLDREQLDSLLERLPSRQNFCLRCLYFLDMTGREVAELLGVSESAVAQHRMIGLRRLREYINTRRYGGREAA